jgi:hypothetical protein
MTVGVDRLTQVGTQAVVVGALVVLEQPLLGKTVVQVGLVYLLLSLEQQITIQAVEVEGLEMAQVVLVLVEEMVVEEQELLPIMLVQLEQ